MNVPENETPAGEGFRAVLAAEPDGPPGRLARLRREELPDDAVTVRVAYSSLNYKDGLAVTGKGKVVRRFPMVCGVDLAGVVENSSDPTFKPGDQVIGTGWGLGEEYFGGYCELARVDPGSLVAIPEGRDALWAMSLGTAGLTAMLSVLALERHDVRFESAGEFPVVVTGAAGGVGSVAVALLAGLGYRVAAVTGRPEHGAYLRELGALEVLARAELAEVPRRPLERERFAGGVDVVGSTTLANVLSRTCRAGCVAACGLAGGADLVTTVHPFILRGVSLVGIDSVRAPHALRNQAWARLATDLAPALVEKMTVVEPLERVPALAEEILAGRTKGRVVIDVAGS
jgi:acrylyl-CoA reductase (NADPH)